MIGQAFREIVAAATSTALEAKPLCSWVQGNTEDVGLGVNHCGGVDK